MHVIDLVNEKIRKALETTDSVETSVIRILTTEWGKKVRQCDLVRGIPELGAHVEHDGDIRRNTSRQARQVIRTLRVKHQIPIISDNGGYWLPSTRTEVEEYITRVERTARAQAAAWHETYRAVGSAFQVTSSFFDSYEADTGPTTT